MDSIGRVATLIDQIVALLHSVGVDARGGAVPGASFLPGIHISSGQVLFDRSRLQWPGDLLHEAGHVAVTPGGQRALLNGALSERADAYQDGEIEAIAWSYAAALAIGVDPAIVFHADGYRGRAEALLRTYSSGVYPGIAGLEAFGMALPASTAGIRGTAAYPGMICWLRP